MAFKIYTKTGDKGETSLIGGTRLPKQHLRIEAYGTVDELNSHIGLVRDACEGRPYYDLLLAIQDRLFTIGSQLAADPEKNKMVLPQIAELDIEAWRACSCFLVSHCTLCLSPCRTCCVAAFRTREGGGNSH